MNDVIKTILSRKGTRVYKKTPISKETLELLAKAAVAAPNAYNAQKWHFSIISNNELLSELEYKVFLKLVEVGICEEGENYKPFHEAPVVMVFSAAMDNEFGKQDCSAANQNVAIAWISNKYSGDVNLTSITLLVVGTQSPKKYSSKILFINAKSSRYAKKQSQ